MVVCKYFLQGCCKFGNNCKFDHPRNQQQGYQPPQPQPSHNRFQTSNQGYDPNRYKLNNNYNQSSGPSQPSNLFTKLISNQPTSSQSSTSSQTFDPDNIKTDNDFLILITSDFKVWLNSSSWKLSCYSYNKSAPCLPLLNDISPEEIRYSVYEAKKVNRHYEEYQQYKQNYESVINLLNQIGNPNQQMKEYLLKYFHESINKSIQQPQQPQQSTVNPFMQIIQNKQQQPQLQSLPQMFQTQSNSQPQPQTASQPSFFQTQPSLPIQNFLKSQQPTQIQASGSVLFTNQTQPNLFSQMINSSQPVTATGVNNVSTLKTTSTQSIVSSSATSNSVEEPNNVYSLKKDLNEQEFNEFQTNKFTIGKIPHMAPPRETCFL